MKRSLAGNPPRRRHRPALSQDRSSSKSRPAASESFLMNKNVLIAFAALMVGGFSALVPPVFAAEEQMIPLEEFEDSRFAILFRSGDYETALPALEDLLRKYPDDSLLLRYQAMTWTHLGRSREAIDQFQELLLRDPSHVPTRYFLGLAYEQAGLIEEAAAEWLWVIENSPVTTYWQWAAAALDHVYDRTSGLGLEEPGTPLPSTEFVPAIKPPAGRPIPSAAPPGAESRWFLAGIVGLEWDSNVTLKPEDKALANAGDQNAERFLANIRVGHHLLREPETALDLLYTARYSAHDDSLDDLNFLSQEASADLRRKVDWAGREVTLGARYDLGLGLLESDLFTLSNGLALTADSRWTPRTRTTLLARTGWIDFGPDGSNVPQTSRDGWYQDVGFTQYLYNSDLRKHLFWTQQYNDTRTQGGNFERRGTTTRLGFHTPLGKKLALDGTVGFRWNKYPRFSSLSTLDPERRRDAVRDFYVGLTYPINPRLAGRISYRFVDAQNRNDFYEYERHVAGVQFLF